MSEDVRVTDPWGDPDPDRVWRPGVDAAPAAAPTAPAAPAAAPGAAQVPAQGAGPDLAPPPLYPQSDQWSYFPPAGLAAPGWTPPPPVPLRERVKGPALTFGWAAAALALLGAPLALLWRVFAPTAVVLQTAGGPQPAAPESNQVWAVDGWFVVVSLVLGAVAGVVAWWPLRDRGPAAPCGLAAGGLAAAAIAAAVGRRLVVDRYLYDFCHQPDIECIVYSGTLRLHALPAIVVFPVAALTAYVLMTVVFDRR